MTTPDTAAKQPKTGERFVLPDPPERELDEKMSTVDHLHQPGNTHHLAQHPGNPESTLVTAERYVTMMPERRLPSGLARRVPDLLIAFGVDPEAYYASNGYIVQEQGKPPDFVLEVAPAAPAPKTPGRNGRITRYWEWPSTGVSTRLGSTTRPSWPATGWWMVGTNPSPSRSWRTACCKATAPR